MILPTHQSALSMVIIADLILIIESPNDLLKRLLALGFMRSDVTGEIWVRAGGQGGAFDDSHGALGLEVHFHFAKFQNSFAYAICIPMKLLVWTTQNDLVQ